MTSPTFSVRRTLLALSSIRDCAAVSGSYLIAVAFTEADWN